MGIRQIKYSELKHPNQTHCSDEIKSVNFKIRKSPCQPSMNQKIQAQDTAKKSSLQKEKGLLV